MNPQNTFTYKMLAKAVDENDAAGLGRLLAARTDPATLGAVLIHAVRKRNGEFARLLLDAGADVNYRDHDGMSALMFSSANGHMELVTFLVERGADVTLRSRDGITTWKYAESNGNDEVAAFLKSKGA